jgi:hypothetical protein
MIGECGESGRKIEEKDQNEEKSKFKDLIANTQKMTNRKN